MTTQFLQKTFLTIITLWVFLAGSYSAQAEEGLLYWPVTPCRIVDTRKAVNPGRIIPGQPKQYHVYGSGANAGRITNQGGKPGGCASPQENPLAVHLNLISAKQSGNGNLVAYPAGEAIPNATLINYRQGVNISNAAIVKTCQSCSPESMIAVASGNAATHAIIDVMGYYFPGSNVAGTIRPTIEDIDGGKRITDAWVSSGGQNRLSFRNHHFLFDVTQAGNVEINIASNVSTYLYLINSLGIVVEQSSQSTINTNLSQGHYKLIAATYYDLEKSSYDLTIQGSIANIRKINSQRIEQTGGWESSGGQSRNSYRNDHYFFDVPSDSYIDIVIQSNANTYMYLVNSLGIIVKETSKNRLVSSVPADSYRLVIATYYVGESSNYIFTAVGQLENLREKASNVIETVGAWTSSGGQDRYSINNPSYSFDVTEEGLIDVTISSSVNNYLYLVDSLDNVVESGSKDRLTAWVSPGQYKLVTATYYTDVSSNFVLTVYGQISNLLQN